MLLNILWIVLDSALAMICAQTSDTWELCDCALFNYIEYFCLKKNPCVDKFFRFWTGHFWLSNCLKSWSDCKICIFVWDFQNMVWNLGVDKNFVDFPCFGTLSSTGRSLGSNQLHIQFTGQTSAVCRKRSKEKEIGKGGTHKIDLRRLRRNVQTLKRSGDKIKQMFKHWRSTW